MPKPNRQWIRRHVRDPFVQKAQQAGYVSRAAFKLVELCDKFDCLHSGDVVVDLGAAPGGWTQVASEKVGESGQVISLDMLPITVSGANIQTIQGDFTEDEVLKALLAVIDQRAVNLVISDMAPNISGKKSIDQPRMLYLLELAWDLAQQVLSPRGSFVAKVFPAPGVDELVQQMKRQMTRVKWFKPQSSRAKSKEIYLFAQGYIA